MVALRADYRLLRASDVSNRASTASCLIIACRAGLSIFPASPRAAIAWVLPIGPAGAWTGHQLALRGPGERLHLRRLVPRPARRGRGGLAFGDWDDPLT